MNAMVAHVVQPAEEAPKVIISHERRCRKFVVEVVRMLRKTSLRMEYQVTNIKTEDCKQICISGIFQHAGH